MASLRAAWSRSEMGRIACDSQRKRITSLFTRLHPSHISHSVSLGWASDEAICPDCTGRGDMQGNQRIEPNRPRKWPKEKIFAKGREFNQTKRIGIDETILENP